MSTGDDGFFGGSRPTTDDAASSSAADAAASPELGGPPLRSDDDDGGSSSSPPSSSIEIRDGDFGDNSDSDSDSSDDDEDDAFFDAAQSIEDIDDDDSDDRLVRFRDTLQIHEDLESASPSSVVSRRRRRRHVGPIRIVLVTANLDSVFPTIESMRRLLPSSGLSLKGDDEYSIREDGEIYAAGGMRRKGEPRRITRRSREEEEDEGGDDDAKTADVIVVGLQNAGFGKDWKPPPPSSATSADPGDGTSAASAAAKTTKKVVAFPWKGLVAMHGLLKEASSSSVGAREGAESSREGRHDDGVPSNADATESAEEEEASRRMKSKEAAPVDRGELLSEMIVRRVNEGTTDDRGGSREGGTNDDDDDERRPEGGGDELRYEMVVWRKKKGVRLAVLVRKSLLRSNEIRYIDSACSKSRLRGPLASAAATTATVGLHRSSETLGRGNAVVASMEIRSTRISFLNVHLDPPSRRTSVAEQIWIEKQDDRDRKRSSAVGDLLGGARTGIFRREYDVSVTSHHCFVFGDMGFEIGKLPPRPRHSPPKSDDGNVDRRYSLKKVVNDRRASLKQLNEQVANWIEHDETKTRSADVLERIDERDWKVLNDADGLVRCLKRKELLVGFQTLPCLFPPTTHVSVGSRGFVYPSRKDGGGGRRTPCYGERVLWSSSHGTEGKVVPLSYGPMPEFDASEHKPVRATFEIEPNRIADDADDDENDEVARGNAEREEGTTGGRSDLHIFLSDLRCANLSIRDSLTRSSDPYVMFVTDPPELLRDPVATTHDDAEYAGLMNELGQEGRGGDSDDDNDDGGRRKNERYRSFRENANELRKVEWDRCRDKVHLHRKDRTGDEYDDDEEEEEEEEEKRGGGFSSRPKVRRRRGEKKKSKQRTVKGWPATRVIPKELNPSWVDDEVQLAFRGGGGGRRGRRGDGLSRRRAKEEEEGGIDLTGATLYVTVMDHDASTEDDLIGTAALSLERLVAESSNDVSEKGLRRMSDTDFSMSSSDGRTMKTVYVNEPLLMDGVEQGYFSCRLFSWWLDEGVAEGGDQANFTMRHWEAREANEEKGGSMRTILPKPPKKGKKKKKGGKGKDDDDGCLVS